MQYLWLGIVILLVVIELATINLTTIWFVISGIITLILSLFIDNLFIQMLVFVLGGVILLLTTRKILLKYLKPRNIKTNIDRIIGMKGIALTEINENSGEVKVDGKRWTAIADETIPVDSTVKILEINSTKLKVKRMEE